MEDPEAVAEPFVENLEDLEAKVVKRIIKSFVELPEVPRQLSKLYLKLAGEEAKLYLRLTPKNLMRLLLKKLMKLLKLDLKPKNFFELGRSKTLDCV